MISQNTPIQILKKLTDSIMSDASTYDDIAEQIEDAAYSCCVDDSSKEALEILSDLARFYERRKSLDMESVRDLADIQMLCGEVLIYTGELVEGIEWFRKASLTDEDYDLPHHTMAMCFMELGELRSAANSLERELYISPGNYHSYMILADIYDSLREFKNIEMILKKLLDRDPDNIRALHRLIDHYERIVPDLDVTLLRSRIINAPPSTIKTDLFIWGYHMLRIGLHEEAITFLEKFEQDYPGLSVVNLLKAFIFDTLKMFSRKKQELAAFKRLNSGRDEFMRTKIDEFEKVFGKRETDKIRKNLSLVSVSTGRVR